MKTLRCLPAVAALAVSSFAAHAAVDTFPTGLSFWGQPAAVTGQSRTVDSQTRHVRVKYGETLVFKDDAGKQFAWTFNGFDSRSVDVSRIAPADFHAAGTVVHIGQNPLTKR